MSDEKKAEGSPWLLYAIIAVMAGIIAWVWLGGPDDAPAPVAEEGTAPAAVGTTAPVVVQGTTETGK